MDRAEKILSFAEARSLVEETARESVARPRVPRHVESVPLLHSGGRVLASELVADRDLPPFDRSARDGYAVRTADLKTLPASLRVVAEVRAGSPIPDRRMEPGEAVEIMTGAPVPEGADAVVMVEYTRPEGMFVVIERNAQLGENIVPRGSESRVGETLLRPGTRIGHAQVAVAAALGKTQLEVFGRPKVAIVATGDEVVDIAAAPLPHQIRNSNTYSLAAQVEAAGGEAVLLPTVRDDATVLRAALERGLLATDLLLISGGVSMGKHDLVEAALRDIGASFLFTGVRIQPGKPVVLGTAHGRYFFGLPGNPVSTMVTFELLAKPLVQALAGLTPPPFGLLKARLGKAFSAKPGLTRFIPGILNRGEVEAAGWKGSGDIASVARSNCYLVSGEEGCDLRPGDLIDVLPWA